VSKKQVRFLLRFWSKRIHKEYSCMKSVKSSSSLALIIFVHARSRLQNNIIAQNLQNILHVWKNDNKDRFVGTNLFHYPLAFYCSFFGLNFSKEYSVKRILRTKKQSHRIFLWACFQNSCLLFSASFSLFVIRQYY